MAWGYDRKIAYDDGCLSLGNLMPQRLNKVLHQIVGIHLLNLKFALA